MNRNITDKQWIANDAWITFPPVSAPHYLPSMAGTLGFALRKADIPGLGPFLARLNPDLNSDDTNPLMKQLWEDLFECSLRDGISHLKYCSSSEFIGNQQRLTRKKDILFFLRSFGMYFTIVFT